jgi:translation initiation factor 5
MSKFTNIGRDDKDPSFRYKMPLIITKIESAGNGIKTVVPNMIELGRALGRPPSYITKFFACELGSICVIDEPARKYIVNGKHDTETLQKKINKFIELFVLCPKCRLPETDLNLDTKKRRITRTCICCGHVSEVDSTHKLCTFIFNNPPRMRKVPGTARAGGAAAAADDDDSGDDFVVEAPPEGGVIDDDDQVRGTRRHRNV